MIDKGDGRLELFRPYLLFINSVRLSQLLVLNIRDIVDCLVFNRLRLVFDTLRVSNLSLQNFDDVISWLNSSYVFERSMQRRPTQSMFPIVLLITLLRRLNR